MAKKTSSWLAEHGGKPSKMGSVKKYLAANPAESKTGKEIAEFLAADTGLAIGESDVNSAKAQLKKESKSKKKAAKKTTKNSAPVAAQAAAPKSNGEMSAAQLAKALVAKVGAVEAAIYVKVAGEM